MFNRGRSLVASLFLLPVLVAACSAGDATAPDVRSDVTRVVGGATMSPAPSVARIVVPDAAGAEPSVLAWVPVYMPSVVCMNLQSAQNAIQAAGIFYSRSVDASGASRMQVNDSNWIVVAQDPQAGVLVGESDALLSAVKIGEPNNC
ncbi:hypothetical protein [Rhodococcus sp. ANT_H53B]|uniref:hypothetical protein n=1 Tax=Rhodococcus sp. ANT_H53B TaxID=2597357 RepID=UPI0021D3C0DC|nr:hypothetical protein [Rhodococcus sp. ANT_H53B]